MLKLRTLHRRHRRTDPPDVSLENRFKENALGAAESTNRSQAAAANPVVYSATRHTEEERSVIERHATADTTFETKGRSDLTQTHMGTSDAGNKGTAGATASRRRKYAVKSMRALHLTGQGRELAARVDRSRLGQELNRCAGSPAAAASSAFALHKK